MRHDYAAIAASTIAAVLLAVNPAAAGDAGKKASGSVSTDTSSSVSTDTKTDGSGSTDSPSASPKMDDAKDTLDAEKKTGLDRADQAAGPHGQQGRDNAREQQDQQESPSASPRMDDQHKDQSSTTTDEKK